MQLILIDDQGNQRQLLINQLGQIAKNKIIYDLTIICSVCGDVVLQTHYDVTHQECCKCVKLKEVEGPFEDSP